MDQHVTGIYCQDNHQRPSNKDAALLNEEYKQCEGRLGIMIESRQTTDKCADLEFLLNPNNLRKEWR